MLSVVNYNVFLGQTFNELTAWLFSQNIQDIYCFQEMPEKMVPAIMKLPGMRDYEACYAQGFVLGGVTYGELTIFNTKKLKLTRQNTINLGGKGERNLVFLRKGLRLSTYVSRMPIDKSALMTTFTYKTKTIELINTHLSSDIHSKRKLNQLGYITGSTNNTVCSLVVGDFNYPFGSKIQNYMRQEGYASMLHNIKTYRFLPGVYWQNDFIFQRRCNVIDIEVVKTPYSDHYPIFFKLKV